MKSQIPVHFISTSVVNRVSADQINTNNPQTYIGYICRKDASTIKYILCFIYLSW